MGVSIGDALEQDLLSQSIDQGLDVTGRQVTSTLIVPCEKHLTTWRWKRNDIRIHWRLLLTEFLPGSPSLLPLVRVNICLIPRGEFR